MNWQELNKLRKKMLDEMYFSMRKKVDTYDKGYKDYLTSQLFPAYERGKRFLYPRIEVELKFNKKKLYNEMLEHIEKRYPDLIEKR